MRFLSVVRVGQSPQAHHVVRIEHRRVLVRGFLFMGILADSCFKPCFTTRSCWATSTRTFTECCGALLPSADCVQLCRGARVSECGFFARSNPALHEECCACRRRITWTDTTVTQRASLRHLIRCVLIRVALKRACGMHGTWLL